MNIMMAVPVKQTRLDPCLLNKGLDPAFNFVTENFTNITGPLAVAIVVVAAVGILILGSTDKVKGPIRAILFAVFALIILIVVVPIVVALAPSNC